MTIGIYALYWEEQDLIYIGQSQNIESRFKEHLYKLKNNNHSNYKVQNVFNLHNTPVLKIIQECSTAELNDKEIEWTKEFDSISTGLNIIEAGQVGFGVNSNASKYSKRQVLKTFSCLYSRDLNSLQDISNKLKVPLHLVNDIACGVNHLWLKNNYPEQYQLMISKKFSAKRLLSIEGICYKNNVALPILISPEGVEYSIKNITEFAAKHDLARTHLGSVINGRRLSHKGWKLKGARPNGEVLS